MSAPEGVVAAVRALAKEGHYGDAIRRLRDIRIPNGALGFGLYDKVQAAITALDDASYECAGPDVVEHTLNALEAVL